MAQGQGAVAGPQLIWVDALWCGKADFGSADCDEGCFCGDAGAYIIKKDTPVPSAPHCEWFCSNLALKVGIPQLGFDIVKHVDGNLWFGSHWQNSKIKDWWILAQGGTIFFPDLFSDISRIYAFDLFIHNTDRHMNNYMVVPSGNSHKLYSFDYGRAWLFHGFPPPTVMTNPALHTVNNKNWLKQINANYFDMSAAVAVLDAIGQVTVAQIDEIIRRQPTNWLPAATISDILAWWNTSVIARLDEIKVGFGNGTLL